MLRNAMAGYAKIIAEGRVLDCHYESLDERNKLSYNGSQYMFFLPRGTTPPKCGIEATKIAESTFMSVWAMPYAYDTHLKKLTEKRQETALVAVSREVESNETVAQDMTPLARMKHLAQRHNVPPWEVLGVTRQASNKEVKEAYHKLSLALHPDKCTEAGAEQGFNMAHAAYAAMIS